MLKKAAALACVICLSGPWASPGLKAGEVRAGTLVVREAWSPATPAGARVGAGYLTVENTGSAPDRLLTVEAEVAGRTEMHETTISGGVARMRPVEAVPAAAGGRLAFEPGAYHLMLLDLKRPLKEGERFRATLVFERAGPIAVEFEVRGLGAGAAHDSHAAH